jgi:hypothetical protein
MQGTDDDDDTQNMVYGVYSMINLLKKKVSKPSIVIYELHYLRTWLQDLGCIVA